MTLSEKIAAYKKSFVAKAPPAALEIMQRATEQLANSGQAQAAVKIGDTAPPFTLANSAGEAQALSDLVARGPVVLTFYRGKW